MTFNPTEASRLAAELREDDARMTPGPWRAGNVETYNVFCPDDAALGPERVLFKMNTNFPPFNADTTGIARLRNNAEPLADQLEAAIAEVARLRTNEARLIALFETADPEVLHATMEMVIRDLDGKATEVERLTSVMVRLDEWEAQLRGGSKPGDVRPFIAQELRHRINGVKP